MKINHDHLTRNTGAALLRLGVLAAAFMSLTSLASAQSINFTTVSSSYTYQGTEDRNTLAGVIAGSPLYYSASLANATYFGGQNTPAGIENHGYYLDVKFQVTSCNDGVWSFRLGPDFGRGGAIFVDGVKLASAVDNLWWGGSVFTNPDEIMFVYDVNLSAGPHRVEVFGFEDCCAGVMSMEFQIGTGGWQQMSLANLNTDQDSDGVPDCEDACPNSITTPTVVIDGRDSGVANLALGAGCTLADVIASCASGARNHGQFVSCVSDLTNSLKKAGVLTGAQKAAIERCAAQSRIGN